MSSPQWEFFEDGLVICYFLQSSRVEDETFKIRNDVVVDLTSKVSKLTFSYLVEPMPRYLEWF